MNKNLIQVICMALCGWTSLAGAADWAAWTERAWQREPAAAAVPVEQAAAAEALQRAGRWFPGPAAVELQRRDDRWQTASGVAEQSLTLSVPLWQTGERAATRTLAQSEAALVQARARRMRQALSLQLVDLASGLAWRREQLRLLTAQRDIAVRLAQETAAATAAGAVAELERNQVAAAQLQTELALSAARAARQQLLATWRQLTGEPAPAALPPLPLPATLPTRETPALAEVQAQLSLAEAQLRLIDAARGEAASLGLTWQQEREANGRPWDDSAGLSLQLPLGSAPARQAERAAAEAARDVAARTLEQARRNQVDARRLARSHLIRAEIAVRHAAERRRLLEANLALVERARKLGEADLPSLLTARIEALDAALGEAEAHHSAQQALAARCFAEGWAP